MIGWAEREAPPSSGSGSRWWWWVVVSLLPVSCTAFAQFPRTYTRTFASFQVRREETLYATRGNARKFHLRPPQTDKFTLAENATILERLVH